jgi:hypothetical protein
MVLNIILTIGLAMLRLHVVVKSKVCAAPRKWSHANLRTTQAIRWRENAERNNTR